MEIPFCLPSEDEIRPLLLWLQSGVPLSTRPPPPSPTLITAGFAQYDLRDLFLFLQMTAFLFSPNLLCNVCIIESLQDILASRRPLSPSSSGQRLCWEHSVSFWEQTPWTISFSPCNPSFLDLLLLLSILECSIEAEVYLPQFAPFLSPFPQICQDTQIMNAKAEFMYAVIYTGCSAYLHVIHILLSPQEIPAIFF